MAYAHAASHHDLHASPSGTTLGRDLAAGAIAGQIAGLVMAVVVMAVFTFFLGKGPLFPVQVIGSFLLGDAALLGVNVGAVLVGLVLHQAGPSLAWGLAYGAILHATDRRSGAVAALIGAAVGLASQAIDVNLVMPVAMRALHGHDLWAENVPALWSWAAHLVFGLSLACFPEVMRRLAGRPGSAQDAA